MTHVIWNGGPSLSSTTTYRGTSEFAVYKVLTKGTDVFAEVTITVSRENSGEWQYELLEISR